MEFGLQKMTLLDYPGKVACTVFTGGCNFRCPFCHNPELVHGGTAPSGMMPEEEILQFLKKRSGLLDGVCITGGEPLIHAGLPDFIAKVRELGFQVFSGDCQGGTISFTGQEDCEILAQKLGHRGVAVRAGLHCAPLAHQSAGTLDTGTVRVSFGHDASVPQAAGFIRILMDIAG